MSDVFISYATRHSVYADFVVNELRSAGYSVWIDWHIAGGAEWGLAILDAVREATVIVIIVTEAAIISDWVRREIQEAKAYRKPCIPVIMENKLDVEKCLHTLGLETKQAINFAQLRSKSALAKLLDALEKETDIWTECVKGLQQLQ